ARCARSTAARRASSSAGPDLGNTRSHTTSSPRLAPATVDTKEAAASMGIFNRFATIFRSKANKVMDNAEDPRETLDYSYQKQLEMLSKVRRGVADVATSRKRLELQMNQLQQQSNKLEDQARKALGMGREDLARGALERKASAQGQLNDL